MTQLFTLHSVYHQVVCCVQNINVTLSHPTPNRSETQCHLQKKEKQEQNICSQIMNKLTAVSPPVRCLFNRSRQVQNLYVTATHKLGRSQSNEQRCGITRARHSTIYKQNTEVRSSVNYSYATEKAADRREL
jgi:hypothetical protein